jgi:hypothetical protein
MIATAQIKTQYLDRIAVCFTSPEQISYTSFDVVRKPKTINYPTLKPERRDQYTANFIDPNDDIVVCSYIKAKRLK